MLIKQAKMSQIKKNNIEREICDIYEEMSDFENQVMMMWNDIIEPYVNNIYQYKIIDNIDSSDFLKFMFDNSPIYKNLLKNLKYAKKKILK